MFIYEWWSSIATLHYWRGYVISTTSLNHCHGGLSSWIFFAFQKEKRGHSSSPHHSFKVQQYFAKSESDPHISHSSPYNTHIIPLVSHQFPSDHHIYGNPLETGSQHLQFLVTFVVDDTSAGAAGQRVLHGRCQFTHHVQMYTHHPQSIYLPAYLPTYLPMYLPTYLPTYLLTQLSIYLSIYTYVYIYISFMPQMYTNPLIIICCTSSSWDPAQTSSATSRPVRNTCGRTVISRDVHGCLVDL